MKRRENNVFNIAFLDLLSGALGAVIILYVAVPKGQNKEVPPEKKIEEVKEDHAQVQKELKKQVKKLSSQNKKLKLKKEELKKKIQKSVNQKKDSEKKNRKDMDVGFNFKGQNIVFVLDISGSMYLEDRIGQVKAGLKMLITSMAPIYKIDVVVFPDSNRSLFRAKWGKLKEMSETNKKDIYQFLLNIEPYGATPTQDALNYALQNYPQTSDIVLLSDGTPTIGNSKRHANIENILQKTNSLNNNAIQINTIGVGSDFLQDKDNKKYRFLNKLASQNDGFFVGF